MCSRNVSSGIGALLSGISPTSVNGFLSLTVCLFSCCYFGATYHYYYYSMDSIAVAGKHFPKDEWCYGHQILCEVPVSAEQTVQSF